MKKKTFATPSIKCINICTQSFIAASITTTPLEVDETVPGEHAAKQGGFFEDEED